jgi:hypothetical protein
MLRRVARRLRGFTAHLQDCRAIIRSWPTRSSTQRWPEASTLTPAGRIPLVVWLVTNDPPDYPDKFVARLVIDLPSPYLLVADSLAEIHAVLPLNLARTDRQPVDPPEVIEIWFAVT